MYIIVGLGNPGRDYAGTRHNIGFDVITRLSDDYNIPLDFKKHKALCGRGYIEGQKVLLAQPQTFMNLSGESVRELMDYYKVSNEEIIIVYDDISLDVGQLRVRPKGSAGGHNGIKSIIQHIGTQEFPRVRVGVGDKPKGWDLADYVLGRFPAEEEPKVRDALVRASQACKRIILDGVEEAMNQFNRKISQDE
ncbi:MAG: aminoacyl-tRNA hydrolase [Acetivibrio ethanolgignens]